MSTSDIPTFDDFTKVNSQQRCEEVSYFLLCGLCANPLCPLWLNRKINHQEHGVKLHKERKERGKDLKMFC